MRREVFAFNGLRTREPTSNRKDHTTNEKCA